jgi:hypothetical protein
MTTNDDQPGGAPAAPPAGAGSAPKTLEQVLKEHPHLEQELTGRTQRIATREKEQGERTALQRWAQQLGVTDGNPEVVAEAFRRYSEQQTANMSEAERIRAEAEKDRQEAARERQEAKQAKFDAVAIKVLSKAGAEAPEVMAAGLPRFGVDLDSDEDAVAKAVEEMKKVLPGSFGGKPTGTPQAGAGQPPAGSPQAGRTGEDKVGDLARRQQERYVNRRGKAPIPGM